MAGSVISTRRAALGFLLIGALAGAAACGDDSIEPDLLDPELIRGVYDYGTLAFDVAGATFGEYDILAALDLDPDTHFLVIANDGTAQLAFQNPSTGALEPANGTYEMLEDGVRIEFTNSGQPGLLLLPQILELTFDEGSEELSFVGDVSVPRSRLVELVPELEDEPLNDPVPGQLTVVFTPR